MSGWIKIHRIFNQWEWYDKSEMVHLFIHLLINANFEDKEWRGVLIKRGQILIGREKLAQSLGMTICSVRTCIDRLKSTNEITIKSTNKYSIVTICNYDKYQSFENTNSQQNNQQSNSENVSQTATTKEFKEVKNKRKKEINTKNSDFDYSKIETKYLDAVKMWMDYKDLRNEVYKNQSTFDIFVKHLVVMSNNDKYLAIAIVEKSIVNNWAGIFDPTESMKVKYRERKQVC